MNGIGIGLGQHISCDYCQQVGLPLHCPGVDAHCTSGEHCTTVMEICAINKSHADHGSRCCNCEQDLQAGRR